MLKVKPRQQQKIPATLLPGFNDKDESNKSTFIHSFIHAFKQGKEGKLLYKRKNYKVGSIIKILISVTIIGFILFFAILNFERTNDGSTSSKKLLSSILSKFSKFSESLTKRRRTPAPMDAARLQEFKTKSMDELKTALVEKHHGHTFYLEEEEDHYITIGADGIKEVGRNLSMDELCELIVRHAGKAWSTRNKMNVIGYFKAEFQGHGFDAVYMYFGSNNQTGVIITPQVAYKGEFQGIVPEGRGTFYGFVEGTKYEGEFKHMKYEGFGTLTQLNGEKEEGEWKDNELQTNEPDA